MQFLNSSIEQQLKAACVFLHSGECRRQWSPFYWCLLTPHFEPRTAWQDRTGQYEGPSRDKVESVRLGQWEKAKRRSCPQAAFPARSQNAQTACCVCCQFERWRGKISSSNLFQGNPPQRKPSSLLLPYSLGQILINLDFLFRKFSSVYPCQQLQFHWFVGQNS